LSSAEFVLYYVCLTQVSYGDISRMCLGSLQISVCRFINVSSNFDVIFLWHKMLW